MNVLALDKPLTSKDLVLDTQGAQSCLNKEGNAVPAREQKQILAGAKSADLSFLKSADGSDVSIVNTDRGLKESRLEGEIKVVSTVGNDTRWVINTH